MSSPAIPLTTAQPTTFGTAFNCPKCGQAGASAYETYHGESLLVDLQPGFYERIEKKKSFRIEVVCENCGTVLPPATYSRPR
jgi:transcription elongation factor Elf1